MVRKTVVSYELEIKELTVLLKVDNHSSWCELWQCSKETFGYLTYITGNSNKIQKL
jgi:hypothetical protein